MSKLLISFSRPSKLLNSLSFNSLSLFLISFWLTSNNPPGVDASGCRYGAFS